MKKLLNKELRLSAHPLSYLFLVFSLMALIPGYPILLGAFFICFGLFQTFQNGRETNDVLYSVLLPIGKKDVVKAEKIADYQKQATFYHETVIPDMEKHI